MSVEAARDSLPGVRVFAALSDWPAEIVRLRQGEGVWEVERVGGGLEGEEGEGTPSLRALPAACPADPTRRHPDSPHDALRSHSLTAIHSRTLMTLRGVYQ